MIKVIRVEKERRLILAESLEIFTRETYSNVSIQALAAESAQNDKITFVYPLCFHKAKPVQLLYPGMLIGL